MNICIPDFTDAQNKVFSHEQGLVPFRENGFITHGKTSLSAVWSSFGTMNEESSRENDISSVCYMTYMFKVEHV